MLVSDRSLSLPTLTLTGKPLAPFDETMDANFVLSEVVRLPNVD
jgi:hypothetical protein